MFFSEIGITDAHVPTELLTSAYSNIEVHLIKKTLAFENKCPRF
jgi:hypothetical protein